MTDPVPHAPSPDPSESSSPDEAPPAPPAAPALTEDQLSGSLFRRWNGGAFVLGVLVLAGAAFVTRGSSGPEVPAAGAPAFDPLHFTSDARWDAGRAEVARYAARRVIYSRAQPYELIRIAVKERFDPSRGVKGEAPGALDALKTVAIHDTPTQRAYSYRQQVVVQVPRGDPRQVLAGSLSSQEWCGSTFVRLKRGPKSPLTTGLERTSHSYWGDEGDRQDSLPADAVLVDQVPFLVRVVNWGRTPTLNLNLLPTLLSNRAKLSVPRPAVLERVAEESVTVPAGTFECVHVRVLRATEAGEVVDHYWVGTGPGRPLVKFKDATGEGELKSLTWEAYWEDPVGEGAPSKGGGASKGAGPSESGGAGK